jgi:uncharacterized protein (DUF58 family)
MAEVVLKNKKRVFPSMCIAMQAGNSEEKTTRRLYLDHALGAGQSRRLEWTFVPSRRGRYEICLNGLESKFPFGFIRKVVGRREEASILVWPARADYEFGFAAGGWRYQTGFSKRQAGSGSDLLNLRHYEKGDPPRLIHWKASARLNKLMTRQLAREGESGYHINLMPDAEDWSGAQLELLCSVVCALSEDLFRAGRLETVSIASGDPLSVRGLRELHSFFDQLAVLAPSNHPRHRAVSAAPRNVISFNPLGEGGVSIHVDGIQAGQA